MTTTLEAKQQVKKAKTAVEDQGRATFNQSFRMMNFETTRWEGQHVIREVIATIDGVAVARTFATPPRVNLIPAAIDKEITNAQSRIRSELDKVTLGGGIKSVRLVGINRIGPLVYAWNRTTSAYFAVADSVVDRYDEIVAYNRATWMDKFSTPEVYALAIERLIPPRDKLRAKFTATHRFLDPAEAVPDKFINHGVDEFLAQSAVNGRQAAADLKESLLREPARQLGEALAGIQLKLIDAKKLSPGSFNQVRDAIALCMACADAIDPAILSEIERMRDQVEAVIGFASRRKENGKSMTDVFRAHEAPLKASFAAVITTLADTAKLETYFEKFGHYPR